MDTDDGFCLFLCSHVIDMVEKNGNLPRKDLPITAAENQPTQCELKYILFSYLLKKQNDGRLLSDFPSQCN